ncbi:MAG TPA: histidine phosphatase family protein [Tepidiformaceae bacterium]
MSARPVRPPTRILLTRHGQTVANREGRFCGQSETPLTDFGVRQANALADRLAGTGIQAAYASDLSRASETAARIVDGRGLELMLDPRLREIFYGDWEMWREREIAKRDPEGFALMRAEDPAWRPPGGEAIAEVRGRTFAAIQAIAKRHAHQTVLVVSHGDALLALVAEVLAIPLEKTYRLEIANCSLSELSMRGGKLALVRLNDTSHLDGLKA